MGGLPGAQVRWCERAPPGGAGGACCGELAPSSVAPVCARPAGRAACPARARCACARRAGPHAPCAPGAAASFGARLLSSGGRACPRSLPRTRPLLRFGRGRGCTRGGAGPLALGGGGLRVPAPLSVRGGLAGYPLSAGPGAGRGCGGRPRRRSPSLVGVGRLSSALFEARRKRDQFWDDDGVDLHYEREFHEVGIGGACQMTRR